MTDSLDRIEEAAGTLGYETRRSRSLLVVDLTPDRQIRFSRGGGRGLVRGRRVENGQEVAEVALLPSRAIELLVNAKRGETDAD